MSHFTKLRTSITDPALLLKALADLGFKECEFHEHAQPLRGYLGDVRSQTGEVIVRRKHLGRLSNDMGFKRNSTGTFDAIISGYDRSKYSQDWLNRLAQRYAYHATREKLEEQGFDLISEETKDGESIRLVLRRMI